MPSTALSYAQSLRVIGQALEALRIDAFELDKSTEGYVVRMGDGKSAGRLSWEETFLKAVSEKIWGQNRFAKESLNPLVFTDTEIARTDTDRSAKRSQLNPIPDTQNLSFGLRALGDFLDQKDARKFTIRWSTHAVTVNYETDSRRAQETFRPENLYDHGVHMYLRRSDRQPPEQT